MSVSSILRAAINKLLHIRIMISQEIDKELEKVKGILEGWQREERGDGEIKMEDFWDGNCNGNYGGM